MQSLTVQTLLFLIEKAIAQETVHYEDIAQKIGTPLRGNALGAAISPLLTEVFEFCRGRGMPYLTSIVVRKNGADHGLPGAGFWQLLGSPDMGRPDKRMWIEHQHRAVFSYWRLSPGAAATAYKTYPEMSRSKAFGLFEVIHPYVLHFIDQMETIGAVGFDEPTGVGALCEDLTFNDPLYVRPPSKRLYINFNLGKRGEGKWSAKLSIPALANAEIEMVSGNKQLVFVEGSIPEDTDHAGLLAVLPQLMNKMLIDCGFTEVTDRLLAERLYEKQAALINGLRQLYLLVPKSDVFARCYEMHRQWSDQARPYSLKATWTSQGLVFALTVGDHPDRRYEALFTSHKNSSRLSNSLPEPSLLDYTRMVNLVDAAVEQLTKSPS